MTDKLINYGEFDFKNSAVIKPLVDNMDVERRSSFKQQNVIVFSADRNLELFPNPADYTIHLYDEIIDVFAVELKVAKIPFNPYNITKYCNKLSVFVTDTTYVLVIKPGTYTVLALKQELILKLTNNIPGATFDVSVDEISQTLTFSCDVPFSIINSVSGTEIPSYLPFSISKLLGFKCQDYTSIADNATNTVSTDYAYNLSNTSPVIINIETMQTKNSYNTVLNKCFGYIYPDIKKNIISNTYSIRKQFNPPCASVDKVRIKFTDISGNLYDFQNQDHLIELVFESYKNIRKYQSYFAS